MTDDQKKIEDLLGRRIGLDPAVMGPHLVLRAARRRMAELGVHELGDYAARVVDSEVEQQALIEEVIVPESWFFRDERPFRWLADHVRAGWIAAPWRPPLHALSLPCAGGQEPYSIAITLRDAGLPARRFGIDAVDVSARMLEIARRGIYSANAFRGAPDSLESRWTRHFRRQAHGYEIDPAIRSTVRFVQANVLDPTLLAGSPPYDVVFCRNLLIYLDTPARARVLATLDRLMADDGVLFIGHADRLEASGMPSRFVAVGEPGCFAYRRAARPAEPGGHRLAPSPPIPMAMLPEPAPMGMPPTMNPVPAPAPQPVDTPAPDVAARPSSTSLLEQAAELANQARHTEAIAACEQHLRLKGPGAAAYYLMGMICQATGDRRRAEDCFRKTIYLDPGHDEALLALALSAERRGDRDAAAAFRRRARRTAAAPANKDHGGPDIPPVKEDHGLEGRATKDHGPQGRATTGEGPRS